MARNKKRAQQAQAEQAKTKVSEAQKADEKVKKSPEAVAGEKAVLAAEDKAADAAEVTVDGKAETAAEVAVDEKVKAAQPKEKKKSSGSSKDKKRDALYQIKTKRTSGIIKSYITFTYRIMHPGVTPRLILYGLLVAAPGVFFFRDVFWKVFFIAIGAALVLLGFFRQYISLAITKSNDPDYKNGAEFTYDFYEMSATFSKNGELVSRITSYKDITAFYYDDEYYYLALSKEVHVLPKNAFTVGEPAAFEEFIYKKSKKTCKWLPNKLSDRMKQRRARRAVSSGSMLDKK